MATRNCFQKDFRVHPFHYFRTWEGLSLYLYSCVKNAERALCYSMEPLKKVVACHYWRNNLPCLARHSLLSKESCYVQSAWIIRQVKILVSEDNRIQQHAVQPPYKYLSLTEHTKNRGRAVTRQNLSDISERLLSLLPDESLSDPSVAHPVIHTGNKSPDALFYLFSCKPPCLLSDCRASAKPLKHPEYK